MLQTFITQRRHAERYRQIARSLVRHGLGGLLGPVDVGGRIRQRVPGLSRTLDPGRDALRRSRPVHLREALEELGPAFVKLGQILSTRADLLPPAYIVELERLQDQVPSEPFDQIRLTVERELGTTIELAFRHFVEVPLAAASIEQVHAAELPDGTRVVVKVQRTGIERTIVEDLDILSDMARMGEARSPLLRQADVTGLVKEFSWTIRSELDYRREAANADLFHSALNDGVTVRIPKSFPTHSSRRVLTMERIDGERIDQMRKRAVNGVSPEEIAHRLVGTTADQILRIGTFHADPHPGNFLVCANGALGILDYGMVGTIDERLRERLMLLAIAVSARDSTRIVDELALLGVLSAGWDRRLMERDVSRLVSQYVGASLRDLPLSMILQDAMNLIRRHGIRMPSELALLAKTASMLESLSRRLDPDINVIAGVEPMIRGASREFLSPGFWAGRFRLLPLDTMLLTAAMPGHIQRLLSRIDRNDLTFHVHYDELPETLRSLNGMVNRLAFAIMTAAAWLGTIAIFLAVDPDLTGVEGVLFGIAFMALAGMVMYGMYSVWRSGR
ncbi:MAG: AarF/ABC1/UbiB kinase family protein [Chloroflexia bacterium]|nr:AarF/ABC1/UbiB kinase family protein [Chloroflexia bacterium]